MSATLNVSLQFDDAVVAKDFFATMLLQDEQGFIQWLGGRLDDVTAATDDDRREFVLARIERGLLDTYQQLKLEKQIQMLRQAESAKAGGVLPSRPDKKVKEGK